jgi:hypothetical protein
MEAPAIRPATNHPGSAQTIRRLQDGHKPETGGVNG